MKQFENVTVVKKANLYFDGNVTSRTVKFEDGTYKTLGVMMPGEYEFGTDSAEIMEILEGQLDVSLPGSSKWQEINGGDTFEVGANSSFVVRVKSITDYCCSYLT